MDNIEISILKFLAKDLEKRETWTTVTMVMEEIGIPVDEAWLSINFLNNEKLVKLCGCGCKGFMISSEGLSAIKAKDATPLVWKTREGNIIRLAHMSDDHLWNAIEWLIKDPDGSWSSLEDTYEGVQIGSWVAHMATELRSRKKDTQEPEKQKYKVEKSHDNEWYVYTTNGRYEAGPYFFRANAEELKDALNRGENP